MACNDDTISRPYDWLTAGSAAGSATRYKMIQSLVSDMVVIAVLWLFGPYCLCWASTSLVGECNL